MNSPGKSPKDKKAAPHCEKGKKCLFNRATLSQLSRKASLFYVNPQFGRILPFLRSGIATLVKILGLYVVTESDRSSDQLSFSENNSGESAMNQDPGRKRSISDFCQKSDREKVGRDSG